VSFKKKSTKSDHVYYTSKIFENFMFLEDENVPLVLGGLRRGRHKIIVFILAIQAKKRPCRGSGLLPFA
jgi:hypothetical protein